MSKLRSEHLVKNHPAHRALALVALLVALDFAHDGGEELKLPRVVGAPIHAGVGGVGGVLGIHGCGVSHDFVVA